MTSRLEELAGEVEKLTGPCREMDAEICVAIGWFVARKGQKSDPVDYVDIREPGKENWPGYGGDQLVPYLTESLDAAMTLVPEGFQWKCGYSRHVPHQASLVDYQGHTGSYDGNSDYSRACALTAASLRARAASEASHGG